MNVIYMWRVLFAFLIVCMQGTVSQELSALATIVSVCNAPPPITIDALGQVLEQVAKTLEDCSRGKAVLKSAMFPYIVNLPCPEAPTSCNIYEWADRVDAVTGFSKREYTNAIYIIPDGCGYAGLGIVGPCLFTEGLKCRTWISQFSSMFVNTYVHELGHNLGLNHADAYGVYPYGDLTCAMGSCCADRCYNAPHSHRLNWSHPQNVFSLPILQSHIIMLPRNNYIIIHDPSKSNMQKTYYVQYRVNAASDTPPSGYTNIVAVYSVSDIKVGFSNLEVILTSKDAWWSPPMAESFRIKVDGDIGLSPDHIDVTLEKPSIERHVFYSTLL
jgi:hypothetical protein